MEDEQIQKYEEKREELNEMWTSKVKEFIERAVQTKVLNGVTSYGIRTEFKLKDDRTVELRSEKYNKKNFYEYLRCEGKYYYGKEDVDIETIREGIVILEELNNILRTKIQKQIDQADSVKRKVEDLEVA